MYLLGVLIVLVPTVLVPTVLGYEKGPPPERCDNMTPGHYGGPKTSSAPYEITFSPDKSTYTANERIQVTLKGIGSQQFKGFLIQPRPSNGDYTTYGSIQSNPDGTRNPCTSKGTNKDVALSHDNNSLKSQMTFTWMAPSSDVGNIVFVFTVVQDYGTYWVKSRSAVLTYADRTGTQATSSAKTDTLTSTVVNPATDTPTSRPTFASNINVDSDCGVTKSCFSDPPACSTDCNYLVTWKETGSEDVEFTVQKKTGENNYWIAIGLSYDDKMGNDSVTECVSYDGVVDVKVSFNDPAFKFNRRLDTSNFGITWIAGAYRDGILSCTFKRKKNAAFASNALGRRRRQTGADDTTFFDLDTEWYLLVAHGTADTGEVTKHSEYPKISDNMINFLSIDTGKGTTQATSDTGVIKKDKNCGTSVGCYHDCDGSDSCGFLLTWIEKGDDIEFTLTCKQRGNNVYCAIGLSSDDKMGDDSVFECASNGDTISVFVSYNDGRSNSRLDQDKFGLSSISASHEDGILKCKFSRKKTAELAAAAFSTRKKRAATTSSTFFDMNKDWTLLFAYGRSTGGGVRKHAVLPTISSQTADFQTSMDISATAVDRTMIKLHENNSKAVQGIDIEDIERKCSAQELKLCLLLSSPEHFVLKGELL